MTQTILKLLAAIMRCWPYPGKSWLWEKCHRFLGSGQVVAVFPRGVKLRIDLSERWQKIMMAGCYERRQLELFKRLLAPGDTFLDVGANIGYYACNLAAVVNPGKVYALEPHPHYAGLLRDNAALNPALAIRAEELAASDHDGTIDLYLPPAGEWFSLEARIGKVEGWTPRPVKTSTLDAYIQSRAIARVTLCKMDIEGAEPLALKGCAQALERGVIESICCEVSPETRRDVFGVLSRFKFDTVLDTQTFLPAAVESITRLSNILWLRGACAGRWKQSGRLKWML